MNEIQYQRPTALADALAILACDGARPLAGGSDLIPQLREGRRQSKIVVDLKHVPELTAIEELEDGSWRIGAAVAIAPLRKHAGFRIAHAALLDSAGLIGSLQVQSRASLGGNLCNAAPSADGVPLLIALDAAAIIHGPAGDRKIPAGEIVAGPGRASLAPGELVVSLLLPKRSQRSADRYCRFTPRREMDIAVAGAGVRIDLAGDGTITAARLVLSSVGPTPIRAVAAEATMIGEKPSAALFHAAGVRAAQETRPISDTRGSAEYRRELVAVLTRRALADCASRLGVSLS
ncbi:FAD binding domain-containing protein [Bosea sp. NPDC055594]